MIRTEIFIDGNFFFQASNFFRYQHPQKKRLNLEGIITLAKKNLSSSKTPAIITRIRIYRGRYPEPTSGESVFEEFATRVGIEINKFPIQNGEEKEVDVALALDAYETAKDNYCDAIVLLAGDADFLPLIKKIHKCHVKTLLIGCNATTEDSWTKTSYRLAKEVYQCILLDEKIKEPALANLLLYDTGSRSENEPAPPQRHPTANSQRKPIQTSATPRR